MSQIAAGAMLDSDARREVVYVLKIDTRTGKYIEKVG